MGTLRISLLGGIRIERDGQTQPEQPTRSVQLLLAYLLLHRHRQHPREALAGLFWGDQPEDSARACLNTALWRLRRIVEPESCARGTYLLNLSGGEVGFNCQSDFWLDVAELEDCAHRALPQPPASADPMAAAALEMATQLYTGDLLDGVYSDWALRERERLRLLYLKSLAWLMAYHRDHRAHERSLALGQRILVHDPLREEIHRDVMRLYLATGQRALALRQYEICRATLASELAVEPMEETQALYAAVAAGGAAAPAAERQIAPAPDDEPVLQSLREALTALDRARDQFRAALRTFEGVASATRAAADEPPATAPRRAEPGESLRRPLGPILRSVSTRRARP